MKKETPVIAGTPEEDLPLDMDERRALIASRNDTKTKPPEKETP